MRFNTQSFKQRFERMGDDAESAFERWAVINDVQFERYGLNRPNISQFWKLPAFIRKTPDFLCYKHRHFAVEAKGVGVAPHIKIKQEDMEVLEAWNEHIEVWFFFYRIVKERTTHTLVPYTTIYGHCYNAPRYAFPDKKEYYKVPTNAFTWEQEEHYERESVGY